MNTSVVETKKVWILTQNENGQNGLQKCQNSLPPYLSNCWNVWNCKFPRQWNFSRKINFGVLHTKDTVAAFTGTIATRVPGHRSHALVLK